MKDPYEKARIEREQRYAQMERERQQRMARMEHERNERLKRQAREQEERVRQRQRNYERLERERNERYARIEREHTERFERLERERKEREKAYRETGEGFKVPFAQTQQGIFSRLFRKNVKTEDTAHDYFRSDYASYINDLLNDLQDNGRHAAQPEAEISPAEKTRRHLMQSMPRDVVQALGTCDEGNVRSLIATVYRARTVDPERSDWDIYVAYRRSVEVEEPDPDMLEKTQIAGLLLQGTRKEAHFPF